MKPIRIQRKRTKGWTKPIAAVNCTRPSKFSNPFKVEKYGLEKSLEYFKMIFTNSNVKAMPLEAQVDLFNSPMFKAYRASDYLSITEMVAKELAGKHLMCYCALDKPCHCDILLEIANPTK